MVTSKFKRFLASEVVFGPKPALMATNQRTITLEESLVKKSRISVWASLVTLCLAATTFAQPPGGGPGGPPPEGRGGPGGRGGFQRMMQMMPVMAALDADKDGEISSEELANATNALKALDKNDDGKLTEEELRPNFEGMRGERGGRGAEGGRGRNAAGGAALINRIMSYDKDEDGKVSKSELPERMQAMFGRADSNNDEFLDQAELEKIAEQMTDRRGPGAQDRCSRTRSWRRKRSRWGRRTSPTTRELRQRS